MARWALLSLVEAIIFMDCLGESMRDRQRAEIECQNGALRMHVVRVGSMLDVRAQCGSALEKLVWEC